MILLSILAHSPDEDAMVLLVLAIPAFFLIMYALWIGVGREYEPGSEDEWIAVDEEKDE